MIQYPPISVDRDGGLFRLVEGSFREIFHRSMETCGVCAPGDAVAFGRIMPTAWIGPKWDNIHGANERIAVQDLYRLAELYTKIVANYLGRRSDGTG